jgi:hypothetical protein
MTRRTATQCPMELGARTIDQSPGQIPSDPSDHSCAPRFRAMDEIVRFFSGSACPTGCEQASGLDAGRRRKLLILCARRLTKMVNVRRLFTIGAPSPRFVSYKQITDDGTKALDGIVEFH